MTITAVLLALLSQSPPNTRTADDLAGHWAGRIEGVGLEFDVDLARDGDTWRGDLSIPAQGLVDSTLVDLVIDGATLRFRLDGIPGEPKFDGALGAEGERIAGTFTQSGASFAFQLERALPTLEDAALRLSDFDEWMAKQLERARVPGAAVAVVWRGEVVLARGYGIADVDTGAATTADTLFAIGSTTKAFTTFALAQAIEEGLLEWDEPVRTWLPELDLVDDFAERELTLRDMVTHRSGLPRHDFVWYANPDLAREEMVERLAHLEPTAGLRETWQYNNLMFATAGVVLARVSGNSWEQRVRSGILEPLGMTRTAFGLAELATRDDVAAAHDRVRGKSVVIATRDLTQIGPAGSIHSSANDMARWIELLLGGGELDGVRLLPEARVAELAEPNMVMPSIGVAADGGPSAYALGWMVDTVEGRLRVHHGGGIDGFTTQVEMYPESQLGIFTVTNRASALTNIAAHELARRMLDLESADLASAAFAENEAQEALTAQLDAASAGERVKDAPPARPLAEYAGRYEHPGYGVFTVRLEGDALQGTFGVFDAPLEPWHFEVFRVGDSQSAAAVQGALVQFQSDVTGHVCALEAPLEATSTVIRFELVPDPAEFTPERLAALAGTFELMGQSLRLEHGATGLTLIVPGQPPHRLEPATHGRFRIAGADGYWARLERAEDGSPTALILIQPNGVFRAERSTSGG
jgi:CubicO group peptidase (beta-lactamase class C family)